MSPVWFVIKKTISWCIFPLGQVLLLGLAGALLWLRRPERRLGPCLLMGACLLLILYSLPLTSGLLLHSLEARNWHYADAAALQRQGVKYILVLGGGAQPGPLSVGDRPTLPTLKRLLEGLRLARLMPEAQLIFSGGSFFQESTSDQAMEDLARDLGQLAKPVIMEGRSWDTDDEARILAKVVGRRPFALVTSASHMPRSLAIFRAHGLHPLPAPADFYTKGMKITPGSFVPGVGGLLGSQKALKEYYGLFWEWLKGLAAS